MKSKTIDHSNHALHRCRITFTATDVQIKQKRDVYARDATHAKEKLELQLGRMGRKVHIVHRVEMY